MKEAGGSEVVMVFTEWNKGIWRAFDKGYGRLLPGEG